jgi:hypothetical protein
MSKFNLQSIRAESDALRVKNSQRSTELRAGAFRSGRQVGKSYPRPHVGSGQVWCCRCNCAADVEETCAHSAGDPGKSRLYIHARCHGEVANILFRFSQWHDFGFAEGKRVEVFGPDNALPEPPRELKAVKIVTPQPKKPQLLLTDRQPISPTPTNDSQTNVDTP